MFELVEIVRNNKKKVTSQVDVKTNVYGLSDKKIEILETYRDQVIESYRNYENAKLIDYKKRHDEISKLLHQWKLKRCELCNAKLRLRKSEYGDFWGCPNYKNGNGTHSIFPEDYETRLNNKIIDCKVRIGGEWVTDILKETGIQGNIAAKELLFFFNQNGYEDLRIKYNYGRPTLDRISGYVRANQASKEEENIVYLYFKRLFEKCERKIQVKYKKANDKIRRVYLDLIVSNEKAVYIIEIKRGCSDTREDQINLYYDLIDFLLKSKNDKRKCYAVFLIFNKEYYTSSYIKYKMLYFDEIKNVGNKTLIEKKLKLNAYRC